MTLKDFLLAILSGAVIIGPFVYQLVERVAFFSRFTPEAKRLVVMALCGLLGIVAWGLAVWLGYIPAAEGRTAIAEAIWQYGVQYGVFTGLSAFGASTVIHGYSVLRRPSGGAT